MQPVLEPPTTVVVVVVAGGDWPDPRVAHRLPDPTFVVAADSGADRARALGLHVDLLVGDLDSVTAVGRRWVEDGGGLVEVHPAAKDESDLELALRRAVAFDARSIVVVGGQGGRPDHELAGLMLLGAPWLADVEVSAWHGSAWMVVVRPGRPAVLDGWTGALVTLLPMVDAVGVTTHGLAYPLDGEPLPVGTTRGLSNVMIGDVAVVSIAAGTVLAIRPDALDPVIGWPEPPRPGHPPAPEERR